METIIKDIRYGIRGLSKRPGFTTVAVLTLALGIGANSAIFSVLNAVLLRPLPYADPDRIVRIDETEGKGGMGVSPPNLLDFQQQNQTFESVAGYSGGSFILTGEGEPLRVQSCAISAELFSVLGVKPLIGRSFSAEDERAGQDSVALISYGLWQRRFGGDHALLQKQITLDGLNYRVAGVMPNGFEFPIQSERVEVWTPLEQPEDLAQLRGAHYLDVVGRIKRDVSLAQAHADVEAIASRIAQQYPKEVSGKTTVVPLKEDLVGQTRPYLLMLAGAALLVLLIAIANVASLTLARAAERQKEIALRTALGASKSRVVRQLLTESLILSFVGGLAGVTLAGWCTGFLVAIAPGDLPRLQSAHVDGRVLLFALATSVISGILLGLIPAWRSTNSDLQTHLKEGETRSASAPRQALRKALVVSEVTLALVLLCGAGLLIRTLWKLNSVNPGFDPDKVLVAELVLPKTKYPDARQQTLFFQQLIDRIKTSPGIDSVGGTSNLPLSGTNMVFLASVEGQSNSSLPASFRAVSHDYFRTMRIPLLKGRWFDEHDTAESQPVVVINETMARQISTNYEEALGKRIKHGFKSQIAEVVGVIGDVKYAGLDQQTKPEMYAPFAQRAWPFMRLVARSKSDPSLVAATIREAVRAIDKDQPVDKLTTMSSVVNASIAGRSFYMQLLGTFAALAFILAAVGIYGVVSYSVAQRTREIGIRVALGASGRNVLGLVLKEALRLTALGVGLGLVGAFAATRVLRSLLFEVKPTDPTTFICLSLLLTLVALLDGYIPARRATKVDPLVALRYE
ncbi:MAG TPA: ABC transporter permease [Pyrinomonadaceae bacterium]|jgi:putative ABC transport system permease protein|nr:ABC transporter permease [Pyrinomonadaceae bacterium]